MTTSRERIHQSINHHQPDMVPVDFGGSPTSGMHVTSVYLLRQAFGLDQPGTPVKIIEPYQCLGEIAPDLLDVLGIDVVPLSGARTMFGFKNEGWKPWTTFDGTPVLVPESFNTVPEPNGDIFMYPEGDRTVPPSGRMPFGGYYFDAIVRQPPFDENNLKVEDNLEEFGYITEEDLRRFRTEADRLYTTTDKALVANFGGTSFGDIALVPASQLKNPKGIRDIEEWYVSTAARQPHIMRIFEKQCEIALANLKKIHEAVGNKVSVAFISGTDFGTQNGPFISKNSYRRLFKPFHRIINDWVHSHTTWKTWIHSCGSITALLPDFIEVGFDVLNPVQTSAANMQPEALKQQFGRQITFWGGGIDTQKTLPYGTPEEVSQEVMARMEIFKPGGGFVFNAVHNVQPRVPKANLVAMVEAIQKYR